MLAKIIQFLLLPAKLRPVEYRRNDF